MAERGPQSSAIGDSGFGHWLGNGTTALHVALKATGCEGKLVAVQPNVCPNVIAAIFSSGNRPLFLDIERTRLGLAPDRLSEELARVGAVIAVHSYGVPCLIDRLAGIAKQRGVPLIEDCAQAEGASYMGQDIGFFGDLAIFSYGAGKIVDAGGGGRILTKDRALADRAAAEIAGLPAAFDHAAADELSGSFKRLYNRHYPDDLAAHRSAFTGQLRAFGARLLGKAAADTEARCGAALRGLQANVEMRRSKARLYGTLFGNVPSVISLPLPEGSVPWRYNIRMDPRRRNEIFRALLQNGVSASTWYPNIAHFLAPDSYEAASTPNADWLDQGIMNLWLDSGTSDEAMRKTVALIAQLADVR